MSGGGTGDGSTPDAPIGTLAGAYNALGTNGGTIVFVGEYSISAKVDVPKHTGKITWTSVYGGVDYRESGAAFKFASAFRVGFGGPTELDYININDASEGAVFAANFNDLTIGENVTTINAGKTYLIGGANNDATVGAFASGKTVTINVNAGSFHTIVAFSRMVNNVSHSGTVNLNMSGNSTALYCYLGSNGTAAKAGTTVFTMRDNAAITTTLYLAGANANTNGSVTVNMHDSASVAAILRYLPTYFLNGTRTLNYEETVTLPAGLTTYFGSVNVIEVETPDVPVEPDEPEIYDVVYLAYGKSGNGFSANSPVGSIEAAHALLPNGGTVVLIGETTISARTNLPTYTGAMTYTSVYDGVDYRTEGARLYFPSGVTVLLGGEATFKDINIHTDTYAYITAGFNPLTFDTGVVTTHTEENLAKDSDETNGLRLAGGYNNTTTDIITDKDAYITLKSGFFRYVHGFSRYTGKVHYTGTANIVVEGTAIVDELITGATQAEGTATNVNLTLSDDACIYNVFVGGQQKTNLLTGTFNFVVNGGDVYEIDAMCLYTAKDCNSSLTYDVATVPEGLVMLAQVAQIKAVQTFCERDNTHDYSAPFASEFDESVMLKKCSICNDIQFVGDLPAATGENVVFVAEGVPTTNFFLRKDAGDSLNKMFADMHALGLKRPDWISYAWRGYYAQYDGYSKQVGNIRVNYPNYDFERAHKTVLQSCSLPGSSEHHLGLACDFHDSTVSEVNPHSHYDKTPEWAWLVRNAYKYGFILRFTPKDTATTGFIYEAWHFRYVGLEHAAAMANLNSNGDPVANADMLATPEWCLEDYAGLVLGMYDLDSSVTVNGGTFANVEGGSRGCDDITFTGEESVVIGEGANVMPEGTTYDVIYFSNGASGNGLTAEAPVGTIEKAYALLGSDGGTLVWMSELSVGAALELPAHEGTVTVTSVYGGVDYRESGAALKYTAAIRVSFNGPTVIENFKIINGQSGDHLLCANFHPLTLGDGMVLVNKNGEVANTLTVVGGGNNNLSVGTLDAGETNTITVKSGTYKQIVAFSAYNTGLSHTGTVNLNISGDTNFTSVIMGAKAIGSKGGTTVMTLTDNASVGTVYLANSDNTVALNGNVTVYAKGNSTIGAFNHYREDLFNEGARTIYYEESANLPTSLETYFDNVKALNAGERTGDATGDGVINLKDIIRALKACSDDTVEISTEADVNRDGSITVLDVMLIIKMILNG